MSKTNAGAGMFAHAAEAAPFRSVPEYAPHTARAKPGGTRWHRPAGGRVKRAIDVALALIALVLLAPMFVLVAALLRIALGRPVFVAEHHIGFAGQPFTTYTFRTSPTRGARVEASDPTVATCIASLRNSGLDRLPQLLSILRGDMSFVGPQPVTRDELGLRGHCAPDYFAARPGLVGPGRASRSGKLRLGRRAALERYYVRRWSVRLDLALLASAVAAVRDVENLN